MNKFEDLLEGIKEFINRFKIVNDNFDKNVVSPQESEKLLNEYTEFILNKQNFDIWEKHADENDKNIQEIISDARLESAHCVWAMEKYRAKDLIENKSNITDYFKNIENCIDNEFGEFKINSNSKVLMIGVGSFPMTPLLIAERTGAEVVGIDIDSEAVDLAKSVLNILDKDLNMLVTTKRCSELDFVGEATHVIFASTIKEKFEMLEELNKLTKEDVVVAMRYGNGFKSLFNYPLETLENTAWLKVGETHNNNNIFDVAIYKKSINERC